MYLKGFDEKVELFVDISQIIESLNAIRLDADGFKIEFFGFSEIIFHEKAVALID